MTSKGKASSKTHVAYLVSWSESERGWGIRPDGASLHLTQDDLTKFVKEYWARMPDDVPHEYSRNDSGTGSLVAISEKMYKELKNSKRYGVRLWRAELNEAVKNGDIKE